MHTRDAAATSGNASNGTPWARHTEFTSVAFCDDHVEPCKVPQRNSSGYLPFFTMTDE